ncbi:protein kinase [Paucibacter sp. R3-3]|uniref:Protein kinase n=1 Tax=Roseateles agri TaxID=3098619 RepID=A0ABU5DME0_9BURK|nr:protein kinase [Paucibacter sp. R3-3]MDY0747472.1 protein kinase [Paucibacter sp. R3-3]
MSEVLKDWAAIEPLLDELLALPPQERDERLQALPPEQQPLRPALESLLRSAAAAEAAAFLERAASLPASEATERQPGQRIGPWELIRELGRGGMASVWLARPAEGEFQREVALKLPHSSHSPQLAERFRREREVLARLSHPGIARLFDAGISADGTPWLAMERVDGQDLLAWCAAQRTTLRQDLALLLQICDALQYAHGRLVIHRDIKPANVLVQADGQIRLLDFGIARLLDDPHDAAATTLTQQGQRPMTPQYASPEQVRGEEPGVASDVYSLGVLAYRLLSGSDPYADAYAPHRAALEQAILEHEPPSPSRQAADQTRRQALRGDLDTIVLKALRKDASQRYATVDALAEDLRRHLDGRPVLAHAPSWRYVAGRFVGRHRWGVGASALAVAALIGTTAWAWHAAVQAREEAQRSQAMYDFVVGLFNPRRLPQPDTRDRDMPASQLIERGAERVLDSLTEQPAVRERLLGDLGTLTQQLGLAPTAKRLAEERVTVARQLHGEHSVAYADALLGQRDVWEASAQYAQGFEQAKQALAIYEAHGERDPLRLARAEMTLGGFGARLHPADEVDLAHLKKAAALLETVPGPTPLGTVYEQLLVVQLSRGDTEAAFQASKAGVQANQRLWGVDDWKTAASEDQTAALAAWTLRPAEAESLFRDALPKLRKAMGPDVVLLARGEANLAQLLFGGAQRDEAAAHMREARRLVELPANRGQLAFTLIVEATGLELAQRGNDWLALRQGCEHWGADVQAPQPALRLRIQQACAASAVHEGDLERAARLLAQGREVAAKSFAKIPARAAVLSLREGELAAARGDAAAAAAAWRECLRLGDASTLAWNAQAWAHLLQQHATLSADEQARLQRLRQQLLDAGGERYYAEFLALLRPA